MKNADLDKFSDEELTRLRTAFEEKWRSAEPPPPQVLYHYTTVLGATGIVESGHLWATLSSCLNDSLEVHHAAAVLRTALVEQAARAHPLFRHMLLPDLALEFDFARQDVLHVFVASLTSNADHPRHWERYADTGRGVALGFRTSDLLEFGRNEERMPFFALSKIVYANDRQREFLRWAASHWFERAKRHFPGFALRTGDLNYLRATLLSGLSVTCGYLPLMKTNDWAVENEWRLAHGHDPNNPDCSVNFRGDVRIPYVELDLRNPNGRIPLCEVISGPAVSDLELISLRRFLDASGYEDVLIATSVQTMSIGS